MSSIVIVTTTDLPWLVKHPNGRPIITRTAQLWAQAAGNADALLDTPVIVSGRPVWSLGPLREQVRRRYYGIDEDYARRLSEPPSRGGRSVPAPAVLIGIAEMARLFAVAPQTIRLRRLIAPGQRIPVESFVLAPPDPEEVGTRASPIWELAEAETYAGVDQDVAQQLRESHRFER